MVEIPGDLDELVRAIVRAELSAGFDDLRRFVDRRISELSAEKTLGSSLGLRQL